MALRLKSSTITSKMTIAVPLLIVQTLLLLPSKSSSQNDPTFVNCPPDSNYTISSPYKSDLDLLLSNLTASAPKSSALFSNASVGGAYGLAQCRPDASPADCADCLNRTLSAFASRCPLRISAAIRFDRCLLRYSDRRFFSVLASDTPMILVNAFNASDPTVFNRQLKELMSEISSEASSTTSRFGAGATNYSEFEKIFGMVQCTRDLSDSDCELCLDQAVGLFPTYAYGKIGAQVLRMSCTARFETSPFFSLSVIPPPSAPPPTLPLAPSPRAEPPPPPSVPASPTGNGSTSSTGSDSGGNNDTAIVLAVVIPSVAAVLLLFTCCIFLRRRRRAQKSLGREDEAELRESLLFDLSTIRDATNNFASENKLGQGGFGAVYKGVLRDGQEIAVKRLGGASAQGLGELRNEVVLVAKLQHRNLVRLLGFCLEEQEKLLVYEYLPNTSLDKFLFDSVRSEQLDWRRRYMIIEGIGRGLLYLHEDSRLRIIHRDLKASNVLLDGDMNPKISDFGLAKLFAVDETQGNTSRIAGTFGYMAPEYAMQGQFSTKSDVYSYGVLVLEIVTGQKNSGFQGSGYATDLVGYVWLHWNKGTALQLRDRSLGDDFHAAELLRCIHIALLCVQEDPTERPSMASVVLMLNSCSTTLPSPSKPAFLALGSTTNTTNAPNLY